MSPALTRGLKKATRTLVQLAAGGALTAAVNVLAGGLSPNTKVLVVAGWTVLVAMAQNSLETSGTIPALLPSPGLVTTAAGGALSTVAGTVDTVVDTAGSVAGDVVDTAGNVVGGLVGTMTPGK